MFLADSTLHREAMVRTNQEGHRDLAGRLIVGGCEGGRKGHRRGFTNELRGRGAVGGLVKKKLVVIANNKFTAHNAEIVVHRMTKGNPFHFQVPMLT
jgi:hypothetical protein